MAKKRNITRFPKVIESRRHDLDEISTSAEEKADKHFFRRLANLAKVRRFVVGWLALMGLLLLVAFLQFGFLRDKYQELVYVPGGTLNEGVVGSYTNANPIYSSSSVDSSVSKLVFAGLLTYDAQEKLVPDLAESISLDEGEKIYTVKLKKDLRWHDGMPLTSKDVAFTYKTIQNPDTKSYLFSSWQGISVEAKDDQTIVFTLPTTFSSFPHSLTTGIIPQHLLANVNPEQLRSNDFNTVRPVGSGPFRYDTVQVDRANPEAKQEHIGFLANKEYHRGEPGIQRYIISTYPNQDKLTKAYKEHEIDAMSAFGKVDKALADDKQNDLYSVSLSGQAMVFFKTSQGVLSDIKVRKALVAGANRPKIIESTGQILKASDSPLLPNQPGYDKTLLQKTGDVNLANQFLNEAGWIVNPATGFRSKDNIELKIKLSGQDTTEYRAVAEELKNQWKDIGVNLEVSLESEDDLRNTVSSHNYEMLISTISIGADPDVFPFWHSSQIDARSKSRLNFSEYQSGKADSALDAGRSRSEPGVRAVKYKPFLEAWLEDSPALALYQPNYTFIVRAPFDGFAATRLVSPVDRYDQVEKWMVRQDRR